VIITSELKQLRIQLHVYPDQLKATIKDLSNFLKEELSTNLIA
jgi:flagellar biosynthesis/type III secretory pathway protein FliH